jgi:hypothetical protein
MKGKRHFIFILLMSICNIGISQTGVRAFLAKPVSELGDKVKNSLGLGAYTNFELSDEFRLRINAQFVKFKPIADTFHFESSNGFSDSEERLYSKYDVFLISAGLDYFSPNLDFGDKIRIYPGFDIFSGVIQLNYDFKNSYSLGEVEGGGYLYGAKLRANLDYEFEPEAYLNFAIGGNFFYNEDRRLDSFFEISIGISFWFNNKSGFDGNEKI